MMRYVWCNLLVMLTATAAPAASYFVATDGKPENDGIVQSPGPPWSLPCRKWAPGNTIIVRPGIYRGPWQIRNHPAKPGGPPTIIQVGSQVEGGGQRRARARPSTWWTARAS